MGDNKKPKSNHLTSKAPLFIETRVASNSMLLPLLLNSIFPPPITIFEPLAVSIVIVPDPSDASSIVRDSKICLNRLNSWQCRHIGRFSLAPKVAYPYWIVRIPVFKFYPNVCADRWDKEKPNTLTPVR